MVKNKMNMSKIILVFIIGIISLNVIFGGQVAKTYLVKGDLTSTPQLITKCQEGSDTGGSAEIDQSQIVIIPEGGSTLSSPSVRPPVNGSNLLELFFVQAETACQLEIYTPNNTTNPIYKKGNLNSTGLKNILKSGIIIGPININSPGNAVDFIVKIKSGVNPIYDTELLTTTITVPNPNAEDNFISADYSDFADYAYDSPGTAGSVNRLVGGSATPPTCDPTNDRTIYNADGTLKYCFGDQGVWVDVKNLYNTDLNEEVLDLPLEEPSPWSTTVTPVLTRYYDTVANSWKVKWKRIDTHAIGPGGAIPMADLNISNRDDAPDGSLLTWDENEDQMVWVDPSEYNAELIDVGTNPSNQPIIVPNKYANLSLRSGNGTVNYLVPVYRMPNAFSIEPLYVSRTHSVPRSFQYNRLAQITMYLNSENNAGTYLVKAYYKRDGASTALQINSFTVYGSQFSYLGQNAYTLGRAIHWTPNSADIGSGILYVTVEKTMNGTSNTISTRNYYISVYDQVSGTIETTNSTCVNHWDCDWRWVGPNYVHSSEHSGTDVMGINATVSGGSGNLRYCATKAGLDCYPTSTSPSNLQFRLPGLGYTNTGYNSVDVKVYVKDMTTMETFILNPTKNVSCNSSTHSC